MSNDITLKVDTDYVYDDNGSLNSDYEILIDYGDGTNPTIYNGTIEHQYDTTDEYTIKIKRVQSIGDDFLFDNDLANAVTEIRIPHQITSIGNNFGACPNLTKIQLPNSLTTVGDWFLGGSERLESIDLPITLASIGEYFMANTGLAGITVPDNIRELPTGFCSPCFDLTEVVLNDGLETIMGSFCLDTNIDTITIPKTVKRINGDFICYYGGTNTLTSVRFMSNTPPTLMFDMDEWRRLGIPFVLEVPQGSLNTYSNANNYPDITEYPEYYEEYLTIEGSIKELDTLIRNNLRTKGITPEQTDGLTTLISRITDIDDGKNHDFLANIGFYDEDNWSETPKLLFEDKGTTGNVNANYTDLNGTINTTVSENGTKISCSTYADCFRRANVIISGDFSAEYTLTQATSENGGLALLSTSNQGLYFYEFSSNKVYLANFSSDLQTNTSYNNNNVLNKTIKLTRTNGVLKVYIDNVEALSYDTNDNQDVYLAWKTHSANGRSFTFKNFKITPLNTGSMTILKDRLIFPNNATFSFENISFPNTFTWNFIAHIKYPEDTIACHGEIDGSNASINNKIDYEFLITITRQNGGTYRVICDTTGDEWSIIDFTQKSLSISPYNFDDPIVITDIYFSEEYEDNDYEKIYYNMVWDYTSTNNSSLEFPVLLLKNGKPYYEYLITEESCRWDITDGLAIPLYYDDSLNGCWGAYHYKRTDDTDTYSWTNPKQYGLKAYSDDHYSTINYYNDEGFSTDYYANGQAEGYEEFETYSTTLRNATVSDEFGMAFEYVADENESDGKGFNIRLYGSSTIYFQYLNGEFVFSSSLTTDILATLNITHSNHMYFTIHRHRENSKPVYTVTANNTEETVTLNITGVINPAIRSVRFEENCEIRKFYYWNIEEVQS